MKQSTTERQAVQLNAVQQHVAIHRQHPVVGMSLLRIAPYKAMGMLFMLICALLLAPMRASAQEFRAVISGTVTDPSGAVVPGASIVVAETHTGAISRTASDRVGQYVVPFLPPGEYTITAKKNGFEVLTRKGITLQAQDHPIIGLALTVGSESDTVTVTADAPLLNVESAAFGAVISTESVANLPLNGRAPAMLSVLSPGVILTSAPGQVHPYDNGSQNALSIGGTAAQVSETLLDGAPNGTDAGSVTYSPSEDSVQEVSVRVFDADASFGHTLGGVINQLTKGGTNRYHGTLYEFSQIPNLDANLYFNDRSVPVTPTPTFHYNQYGLTVGGPVSIPKLFSGKDKLFFFFAWEALKASTPATTLATVPTDAERLGDFSGLLAGGSSYQLYEPNTGTLVGGAFTRTPVPNNCLTNLSSYCKTVANAGYTLNPIALNYLKLYPEPNFTSGVSPITNTNNFNSNAPGTNVYANEFGRLDYNLTSHNHAFFDFRHNTLAQGKGNTFYNNSTGSVLTRENWGATLDNVFTMNATTAFDVRINWSYFNQAHGVYSAAYSPTDLGFPAYMQASSNYVEMPLVSFSSYTTLGNTGADRNPTTDYQLFADMTKALGRHTLKIGFDGRQYRQNGTTYGASTGTFSFGTNFVTAGTGASSQPVGGDLASFELGLPTAGSLVNNAIGDFRSYYFAGFVQDDWKANSQLTLNLGLRYDLDTPWGEKFGRTISGFNPTAVNSASAAATTAFAPTSVTKNNTTVSVSSINTLGGLTFPNVNGGAPYQIGDNHGFLSPRFGFSFNPERFKKMVIRGGFAIFVQPQLLAGAAYQSGFSASTSYQATNNSYFTNLSTLTNPFPSGFTQPTGSSLGASTFLGSPSAISFFAPIQHDEYSERWTLGTQYAVTNNTLVEVLYEGNHGVHIPVSSQNINAVKTQYLTTNPYRNANLATAIATAVTNPYAGLLPQGNSSYNGATTSLSSLLVPYPAFGSASISERTETIGQTYYDSAMVHVEQRSKHGLTLTANYSFSKLIEADTRLNDEDNFLEHRISPTDFTHHFTVGTSYALPFGHNKQFSMGGSRLWDEIAGGWSINAIYQFQTGPPITFSADIPFQPGMSYKNIQSSPRNVSPSGSGTPALTNAPNIFVTGSTTTCTVSSSQPCDGTAFFNGQYTNHYRTMPTTISSVRADGYNNLDASVLKDFRFTEKSYLQIRFETFNTLNHPVFAAPNVSSATATTFGYITAVNGSSLPRQVQLGGRIVF